MKIIAILVLVFGVTLAGGAIYFASQYFDQFEARMASKQPSGPKMVNIVVATTQLPYGTVLDNQKHLRWQPWPEDSLPEGAFTDAKALLGDSSIKDRSRVVLRQIEAGEPILASKITGFGARQRMAMQLGEGKRAFAIRIDAVSGVAGFIAPGDHVDVMMTRSVNQSLESVVILRGVRVIAVDHETNQESNRPRVAQTATVEVTPTDAQKLSLAQQLGKLSLTLRGLEEVGTTDDAKPQTLDLRDLLGIEEAAPAAPRQERASTSVTVRKGGEVSNRVEFQQE